MIAKCLILVAVVAYARAGLLAAPAYAGVVSPAIGSQSQSVLRSYDGSAAVSQYSKAVDTAYSSVRKSDIRITNPGIRTLAATSPYAYAAQASPLAYASPAIAHSPLAYASPAIAHAPLSYAAPIARAGLVGVGYSAAPAVAHISYDSPISHYAW